MLTLPRVRIAITSRFRKCVTTAKLPILRNTLTLLIKAAEHEHRFKTFEPLKTETATKNTKGWNI